MAPDPRAAARRRRHLAGWIVTGTAATGTMLLIAAMVSLSALLGATVLWGPEIAHAVWRWVPDVPGVHLKSRLSR
jgi:uncharacterized membrane protein YbhN (UPF0104 family)